MGFNIKRPPRMGKKKKKKRERDKTMGVGEKKKSTKTYIRSIPLEKISNEVIFNHKLTQNKILNKLQLYFIIF